ncbi:MAG: 16S rRNA (cytosine(967)-C(5))-methyltransferase RsmB [candidate division Zixibacteria bacterium]|nr:16S rRNA (cytosine(967)-C(5))-methyltransferase RsmB [candidate division Zixibacteria bacterium]
MGTQRTSGGRSQYDHVRAAALDAIMLIQQGRQTEDAVGEATSGRKLTPLDHRFVLQLVNGTTKMRRRLDHEIKFYLARPSIPLSPRLSNILRLGFYQLLFTSRVPEAAAVSESVNLARKFLDDRQARLVNAVMRSRLRQPEKIHFADSREDPAKYLADFYSYPSYFVEYCLKEFRFADTERLLQNYNLPPTVTYRVNYLKCKPEEVTALLDEHNIAYTVGKYLPEFIHLSTSGLPLEDELIKTGMVTVQSESAGLPVRLLNPQPGMNVVDLTAAPGGKTTHAAIRMRNKGRLTAVDKSHFRLNMLVQNAERMGIKIISPVVCDMIEFEGGPFDRVLLDPPCSGWGTAGKHADLRWGKSLQDINNLVKIQTAMIDRASRLVKPGGILVYSTCSIIRKENDQIVEEFLLRNKKFSIESAAALVAKELVNDRGFCKTYPVMGDLDGAFCARLVRKQE